MTAPNKPCPVCKDGLPVADFMTVNDGVRVNCPRCLPFWISGTAAEDVGARLASDRVASAILSSATRRMHDHETDAVTLTTYVIDSILAESKLPSSHTHSILVGSVFVRGLLRT